MRVCCTTRKAAMSCPMAILGARIVALSCDHDDISVRVFAVDNGDPGDDDLVRVNIALLDGGASGGGHGAGDDDLVRLTIDVAKIDYLRAFLVILM